MADPIVSAAVAGKRATAALAHTFARRRNLGQVYMGGESDPTPGDVRAAEMFVRDLIDAGWKPPVSAGWKPPVSTCRACSPRCPECTWEQETCECYTHTEEDTR